MKKEKLTTQGRPSFQLIFRNERDKKVVEYINKHKRDLIYHIRKQIERMAENDEKF